MGVAGISSLHTAMHPDILEPYQELEQKYAQFVGSSYGVSCNSGTSALHLALLGLGVVAGDEVIVPDFTMGSVAFAVSYCGARPVFADVSLDDYGLDPLDFQKKITTQTKAVIVVHTYGRLAQVDKIIEIAHARGIKVIEDACEAQGAVYDSKADATCWSFYRNKIIAAEEGGMVTTHNLEFAQNIADLKNMAFGPKHDYFHERIGFNYRMPNAMAKLALVSLHKYADNAKARRKVEHWYNIRMPYHLPCRQAVWFYDVCMSKKVLEVCPEARDAFKPLSTFPMYGAGKGLPNARALSRVLVLLPVRPDMTEKDVQRICSVVSRSLEGGELDAGTTAEESTPERTRLKGGAYDRDRHAPA